MLVRQGVAGSPAILAGVGSHGSPLAPVTLKPTGHNLQPSSD